MDRPLRLSIKSPDRFNLIPEKLHPHRLILLRRKHIQNPAANRILPRHLHRISLLVTHALQMQRQIIQRNFVVNLQRLCQLPVICGSFRARQSRSHWHQHNPRLAMGQFTKSRSASRQNLGMGRHRLTRQHVQSRQQQGRVSRIHQIAECSQQRKKRFRLLVPVNNHNLWTPRRRMQQSAVDRLGRQRQPGQPEQTRATGRPDPVNQRLESGIARQTRKQLFDLRIPQTEGSVAF